MAEAVAQLTRGLGTDESRLYVELGSEFALDRTPFQPDRGIAAKA